MPRKPKATSRKKTRTRKAETLEQLYPSLAEGPTPEERLAKLLREAEAKGRKPMDAATLEAMAEVWPEDEDLDEFLAWLYESRRTGRDG